MRVRATLSARGRMAGVRVGVGVMVRVRVGVRIFTITSD